MLKKERQNEIIKMIQNEGKAIAKELSIHLNVSEDTIRRDLREMDAKGLIQRVHGGAFPISQSAITFAERNEELLESKRVLAMKGLELVTDGQVILLDGSTTNLQLAKELPEQLHATIITNSPTICLELSGHPHLEVITLGGTLFKDSLVNVGLPVIKTLEDLRADLCFLGVYSIHPEFGISEPHMEESFVRQQMIKSSNKIATLVTKNKLNTISNYKIGSIASLDYLITEGEIPSHVLKGYEDVDIEVIRC
ncbi:DeoR/GlpR family DNA-binding transcription regulator [Shouchella shacheensis]|uniref:DeoR/GlpR family DNA-binding transcription regulator n=1 Tax=Shouchella shacheensis TaxID=1649580 RepID=UPI00074029F6|nr:DeoR/GlpR family DNA-binding transcription regulator [Shouchella shacheensis]